MANFQYSNIPLIESCEDLCLKQVTTFGKPIPKVARDSQIFLRLLSYFGTPTWHEEKPSKRKNKKRKHTHTHRLTHDVQPLLNQAVTVESALAIFCLDLYTVYPMSREIAPTGVQGRCNSLNFRKTLDRLPQRNRRA